MVYFQSSPAQLKHMDILLAVLQQDEGWSIVTLCIDMLTLHLGFPAPRHHQTHKSLDFPCSYSTCRP